MSIELRDHSGIPIGYLVMALGWDPIRRWFRERDIDLNAAALLFRGEQLTDVVYHEQLESRDGSVRHHGDSTTGEGKGDNEIITVDLATVPAEVSTVLFLVTCYSGHTFAAVRNAFWRMVDGGSDTEISRHQLSGVAATGLVMGTVVRADGGWKFRNINEGIPAQHPVEAAPYLRQYLG
ncbi:TerD family protein [Nocardia sp. CNY236]|uniref:TerD family protein n=1 Tax=Nocardia sp. CNY236 TaxID=1169152 RepID=UPI0004290194|nr:TerD family protein [Nocardia sp. CNY236]